jgi:putative flippase GtrA
LQQIGLPLLRNKTAELIKYFINGLVATSVHYGVLTFNIEMIGLPSAGLANLIAACFGIASSFMGSRYFVFKKYKVSIISQAIKFSALYVILALLHGFILFIWSDWLKQDYRSGFLVATFFQFVLSYIGNKKVVFKI